MSAHSSSFSFSPSGTSRTATGTFSRPARWAARQRRSPAMISYAFPARRTTMGWMRPLDLIERASSSMRASSARARGWYGFGES